MKDKEVLQKAIENVMIIDKDDQDHIYICNKQFYATFNIHKDKIVEELFCIEFPFNGNLDNSKVYAFIFSHDFAKAFFGNEKHRKNRCDIIDNCTCGELTYHYYETYEDGEVRNCTEFCWQYHLQQMVLCDNPINYLRKFIKE